MILPAESLHALQYLAEDYKFWITIAGMIASGYKAFQWIKEIRTKDLVAVHQGIQEIKTGLNSLGMKLDSQTNSVVGELKELRNDFRTFIPMATYMSPVAARPAAKRTRKPKTTGTITVTTTKDLQSI